MRDGQPRRRGKGGPSSRPPHPGGRQPYHGGGKPPARQGPPRQHYAPRPAAPPLQPEPLDDGPPGELGPPQDGVLELHPRGYGFLRSPVKNYTPQPTDPYVPQPLLQRLNLREGLLLSGPVEAARGNTGPRLGRIELIEGQPVDAYKPRTFDDLTAIDPHEQIVLETGSEPFTTRVMDLLTPIGKGQRGLIVAPPRTGKTIMLQHIAQAVTKNHPEMQLFMLLVDERPEEVTEMKRTIKGEVVASSSDRDTVSHIRLAELVVERGKRLAEQGKQVFVLIDSLTRLSRAYNKNVGNSGRTMSGGIDSRAMEVPRRLFGAARVFEEGGSLTVVATALIDTGSRMDDFIFQEFKGTGNMELVLDRKLADRRIYPAIDFTQSGTRKEERILPAETLKRTTLLRRSMVQMNHVTAMESLVAQLGKYPSNAALLDRVATFIRD